MLKYFLAVPISAFLFLQLNAGSHRIYPGSIGLFVTGKGCINVAEPFPGMKNDFLISPLPDIGFGLCYPLSNSINFGLKTDISYLTLVFKNTVSEFPSFNLRFQFNYFNIGIGTYLSWLSLSLNMGIPLSGKVDAIGFVVSDSNKKDLNPTFQLRLGGTIPILAQKFGQLNLLIFGNYCLNGLFVENSNDNPRIVSLSIGMSYLLHLRK